MNRFILTVLCSLLLAGCGDTQRDIAEEKDPRIHKGLELVHLKNWDGAISQFRKALAKNPDLARPDLELALIYQQRKNDYIKAIYHYERYLEKRPATEKRPLILDWIRQAKISLAGEIGRTSGDISEELVRLKRENNLLKQRLEAFEGKTAPAPTVANVKTMVEESPVVAQKTVTAAEPKPEPVKPVVEEKPEIPVQKKIPETYTVRSGDTLSGISRKVYGESGQWRAIYEANRDTMESENDLRAGQVIKIPAL